MKQSIDFGSRVFKIEIVDKLLTDENGGSKKISGSIDAGKCLIQIEKQSDPQSQIVVLWHEIVHHLLGKVGHDGDDFINPRMEEAIVEGLSDGIVMVLRLNPWIGDIK